MRIAPPTVAAPPARSSAEEFVERAQWLLQPGSVVTGMYVLPGNVVGLVVKDPLVTDPHDQPEADRLAADSAMTVLEQAAHGVKLVATTQRGYVGQLRDLAPAQLTFATGLPGVQRYDLVPSDVDGDGFTAPGEVAHRIEVDGDADVARIDWLLRDRFDEGSVENGPVQIVVPERPWRSSTDR